MGTPVSSMTFMFSVLLPFINIEFHSFISRKSSEHNPDDDYITITKLGNSCFTSMSFLGDRIAKWRYKHYGQTTARHDNLDSSWIGITPHSTQRNLKIKASVSNFQIPSNLYKESRKQLSSLSMSHPQHYRAARGQMETSDLASVFVRIHQSL